MLDRKGLPALKALLAPRALLAPKECRVLLALLETLAPKV